MSSTKGLESAQHPTPIAVLDDIKDQVPKDLLIGATRAMYGTGSVLISDPMNRVVPYTIMTRGISGPDPAQHHEGKTRFDAVVCNIADVLAALHGFEYNSGTKLYQRTA